LLVTATISVYLLSGVKWMYERCGAHGGPPGDMVSMRRKRCFDERDDDGVGWQAGGDADGGAAGRWGRGGCDGDGVGDDGARGAGAGALRRAARDSRYLGEDARGLASALGDG